ncbi:MAG: WecB/TagA/CpsF family glycosyltransferase [Firmicutes bacterium]|nr:WecB/TagA/CpsF family glycosyltransferase [Bacillota bacterium]
MPERVEILGLQVDRVNMEEVLQKTEEFIKDGGFHQVVTLGTEMAVTASYDKEFKEVINSAHLVVPDSVGILWAAKKKGKVLSERVAGIDIIYRLSELAIKKGWSFYLLGAKPGIAEAAAENLCKFREGLKIAGTHHGYFTDDAGVIEDIKRCKPDILLAAMGFPRQEKWIRNNREILGVPVCIGVGGSFDVLSGKLKRAPDIFIKLGLEWFYRFFKEPSRFQRLMALPKFMIMVYKEKLFRR